MTVNSKTEAGTCVPCLAGQYQEENDFQGTTCKKCRLSECPKPGEVMTGACPVGGPEDTLMCNKCAENTFNEAVQRVVHTSTAAGVHTTTKPVARIEGDESTAWCKRCEFGCDAGSYGEYDEAIGTCVAGSTKNAATCERCPKTCFIQ